MSFDFTTMPDRLDELDQVSDGNLRGKGLEILVTEMLSELPGVSVTDRNVLSAHGEAELDLLVLNAAHEDGLPGFERDLIVECKSSRSSLGAAGVTHFATQVERRKLRWSVIVSLAGLTGDGRDARAAHHEVSRYAEKGHGILLLVAHELRGIRSADHLATVLERKRQKLIYSLRAEIFPDSTLRELDPDKGLHLIRGWVGIENATRQARGRDTADL